MKNQMIFLTIAMLFSGLAMASTSGMNYWQTEQADNTPIQTRIESLLQSGDNDATIKQVLQSWGYAFTNPEAEEEYIKDAKEAYAAAEKVFDSSNSGLAENND